MVTDVSRKQPSDHHHVLKVILIGTGGVGKTSLMKRYVNDIFEERTLHTIGVEFLNKELVVDRKLYTLQIWDTGGQERFRSLRTPFYRGSDICILVFDLTNRETFLDLDYWLSEFIKYADVDEVTDHPFLLLGNKADLNSRLVSSEEVFHWCKTNGNMAYLETSAKLTTNVEEGFLLSVQKAQEFQKLERDRCNTEPYGRTIKITKRSNSRNHRKCCTQE